MLVVAAALVWFPNVAAVCTYTSKVNNFTVLWKTELLYVYNIRVSRFVVAKFSEFRIYNRIRVTTAGMNKAFSLQTLISESSWICIQAAHA